MDRLLARVSIVEAARSASGRTLDGLVRLLSDAGGRAGIVIVDLEPLRESSQVVSLAGALDAVAIVVQADRERREVVSRSVETLTRAGHRVAGAVLNKRVRRIPAFLYRWL